MLVVYSLKIKSIHFKYLLLGILSILELLKKKEQVKLLGIQIKRKRKKTQKYTILKSPFINKKSREQFKFQFHTAVIFFALGVGYLEPFIESLLSNHSNSQYLECKLFVKCKSV